MTVFIFVAAAAISAAPATVEAQALGEFATYCAKSTSLWGKSLCGPVVIVDPGDRRAIANVRPPDLSFRREGDYSAGTLPSELSLANTSIEWGEQRWAQVLRPLPDDAAERRVLIAHEAFHQIQPDLGFESSEGDNGHLDSKDGRIHARLEMKALEAALNAPRDGRDWRAAARDALAYRSARLDAFPTAAEAEAALLGNEGLAEYTGIRVGAPAERTKLAIKRLDSGTERASLIRSFGYVVGPAYGLLLDRTGMPWRQAALTGGPLPELLAKALGAPEKLEANLAAYGAPTIIAEESARDEQIRQRREALTAALVDGPTVMFPFKQMQIDFDPNSLFALDEEGTVYRGATSIRDSWGELKATENVLISPNWSFARVPGPATSDGQRISGPGWSAILAPGHELTAGNRPGEQVVRKAAQ